MLKFESESARACVLIYVISSQFFSVQGSSVELFDLKKRLFDHELLFLLQLFSLFCLCFCFLRVSCVICRVFQVQGVQDVLEVFHGDVREELLISYFAARLGGGDAVLVTGVSVGVGLVAVGVGRARHDGEYEGPGQPGEREEGNLQPFLHEGELHELHGHPEEQVPLHERQEVVLGALEAALSVQALDERREGEEDGVVHKRHEAQLRRQRLLQRGQVVRRHQPRQRGEVLPLALSHDHGERHVLPGSVQSVEQPERHAALSVVLFALAEPLRDQVARHRQARARCHLRRQRVARQALLVLIQQPWCAHARWCC
mmetsp:Transcript_15753/g.21612  ORF Transcript_15753/g.21612 Transcript_15753/m.21612 type:complete len:315 (-) Transcript_15753:38-982(-)